MPLIYIIKSLNFNIIFFIMFFFLQEMNDEWIISTKYLIIANNKQTYIKLKNNFDKINPIIWICL